jgi:hypothetical protein
VSGGSEADQGELREDEPSELDRITAKANRELRAWTEGPSFRFLGGELPIRALAAFGIFIAAFTVVYLALWALLGGLGLALGWIVAALAGAAVVYGAAGSSRR